MRALGLKTSPLAAAVLLALCAPAAAAEGDEEMARLTEPQSEISIGAGQVRDDNQRFGQYTGLTDEGLYGLLDADIVQRDDATGTWLRLNARNLGFDSRSVRFEHERQGDWGYFIEYNQIPRFDPYTVNTGLEGIGSTALTPVTVTPGSGADYELKTERDIVTVGLRKSLARGLGLQVRLSTEEKEGLRRWGQGTFGAGWRFLAEPINQKTRQLDATLNYSAGKLQLSGGYYGASFANSNAVLTVNGPTLFPGSDQMALPPDNQSHQLHLAGGYNFTPSTRAMFKAAYGRITQDEDFSTVPVLGAPASLDGRIDTTLLEGGLTTRPMADLTVRAKLSYEDRNDKTPVFLYFPSQDNPGATNNGTNEARDLKKTLGKLEGTYRLPMAFSLTGGLEYLEKKRNSPPVRSVDFRNTTDETSYRAELRRSIAETLTGAVSYIHSRRRGSEWLTNFGNDVLTTTGDLIAPLHLADRDRDMVRLVLNWMPADPLSLNLRVDAAEDDYASRGLTDFDLGPRRGEARFYSLDAGYAITQDMQATAWISRSTDEYEHALCRDDVANTCNQTVVQPVWGSELRHRQDSVGLGLRAQPSTRTELGADVSYSRMADEMRLFDIEPAVDLLALPDVHTRLTTVKLFAKYALRRTSGVRLQYVYERFSTDDWTWNRWIYSDGTRVLEAPKQKAHFVGLAYYFHF